MGQQRKDECKKRSASMMRMAKIQLMTKRDWDPHERTQNTEQRCPPDQRVAQSKMRIQRIQSRRKIRKTKGSMKRRPRRIRNARRTGSEGKLKGAILMARRGWMLMLKPKSCLAQ